MTMTEYKTPYLSLYVQDNYILAMANEYTQISEKEIDFLSSVAKKHFSDSFGVVEVRNQNISMDPKIHMKVRQAIPNFAAYALVTNCKEAIKHFSSNDAFMKYDHHKLCNTVEEAKNWMISVLPNNPKLKTA